MNIICTHNLVCDLTHLALVPAASDRMLQKSLSSDSDVIIYDLEDSVPPSVRDKDGARSRLANFLQVSSKVAQLYFVTTKLRYSTVESCGRVTST